MTHIVIHGDVTGVTQYRQFDDLANALAYLEEQRNTARVDDARLFELSEVHFEVKPYYRVEVVSGATAPTAVPAAPSSETIGIDISPVDFAHFGASEIADPIEPITSGSDGRRGLFGR